MKTETRTGVEARVLTRMAISAIVCCYTEERYEQILEAVASLKAQTFPVDEIIVVVDGNPALYARLQREELASNVLVVLSSNGRGLSSARNAGIRASGGDLIAYLDDDAIAHGDWLTNLVGLFDNPLVWAAGGTAVLDWLTRRPRWFPLELDWVVGGSFTWLPPVQSIVANPHGHNMIFRRAVFDAVGGFDESLGRVGAGGQGGEERDLCLRLYEARPETLVVFEPTAVVRHQVPAARATLSYFAKRSFNEGVSKARIHASNSRGLATEGGYLRHLLLRAIPSRLRRLHEPEALPQVGAIVSCICLTGAGYVVGRVRDLLPQ